MTGKTPDFVAAGTAYAKDMAQRLVMNKLERVTNLIPGMGKKGGGSGNNQQNSNKNQQGGGGNGPSDGIKSLGQPGSCDHLRQGSGTGPYRGGAHSKTSDLSPKQHISYSQRH